MLHGLGCLYKSRALLLDLPLMTLTVVVTSFVIKLLFLDLQMT